MREHENKSSQKTSQKTLCKCMKVIGLQFAPTYEPITFISMFRVLGVNREIKIQWVKLSHS